MKTAGVVLDFYDDPSGALLKKMFPTLDSLHEYIKTAHILTPEEHEVLRDEAYALIMVNEGKVLRKFACVDAGNTLLSSLYFEQNAHLLPEEAVKVAAVNLSSFCEDFDMDPTDFVKMAASGMARNRDTMRQPVVGDEADWAARTNLVSVRGGADSGRVIPTANQMKTASGGREVGYLDSFHKLNPEAQPPKDGGMTLTNDKRVEGTKTKQPHLQHKTKTPDKNTFAVGPGKGDLEVNYKQTQWPGKTPKLAAMVDVSGKEPLHTFERKTASVTALDGRYPLDSYADVKKAVEYFAENWTEMAPEDRHTYAVKTAARAEQLGIEVGDHLARYGSISYAPDVDAHLANRISVCEPEYSGAYEELREKRASIEPEKFAEILGKVDEASGLKWVWGGEVSDPYLATFGGMSEKQASAAWDWEGRLGDRLTSEQLRKLCIEGRGILKKYFSHDIVNALQKDPITVFESLPDNSKILIARMANDEFDSLTTN